MRAEVLTAVNESAVFWDVARSATQELRVAVILMYTIVTNFYRVLT
jgi:hypothetical protein